MRIKKKLCGWQECIIRVASQKGPFLASQTASPITRIPRSPGVVVVGCLSSKEAVETLETFRLRYFCRSCRVSTKLYIAIGWFACGVFHVPTNV